MTPDARGLARIVRDADCDREAVAYAIAWAEGATLAESRRRVTARDDVWEVSPWRSPVVGVGEYLSRAVRMLG